jgi:pimeloyl-ACP methyl ester carboxylesterase
VRARRDGGRSRVWLLPALVVLLWLLSACRQPDVTPTALAPATIPAATATPAVVATAAPAAPLDPQPAATATATRVALPARHEARFEPAACEFEVPPQRDVTCGYLIVAEDRDDPANEATVALHVAIFASESADPAPEPVVYLEGGPGGDALEAIPYSFEQRFAPFLAGHTFIMFDQRGTGYSQPSLACPENTALMLELLDQVLGDDEIRELNLAMLAECRARLLAGEVNLAAYHSAASAADVDDLRRALGYEQVHLYGISYGTRLAQTVMRDYPEGVRSAILDSAYPIAADLVAELPANASRAFATFFAGCAADPACASAYPDLEARFWDLVDALDEAPVTIPVFYLFDRQNYEAALQGNDLIAVVFQGLYSAQVIPALPQLIAGMEAGNYELLSALVSNFILSSEFTSLGMHYAVQCAEEVPFAGDESLDGVIYPRLQAYYEGSVADDFAACDLWDVPAAAALENEPVSSQIPALVLAGEYDPITPPAWGRQVAATLDNATYVEFPGLGHGVSVDHPCPLEIALAFLAAPEEQPSRSCVAGMGGPPFIVPGEPEAVTLVPFREEILGTAYRGVAPRGWDDQGNGSFARQQTALDQTVLLQQVVRGGNAELFVGLLAEQLGIAETPASSGEYGDSSGRAWALYEMDVQGSRVDLALAEEGRVTFIVMLFSNSSEQAFYFDEVFLPALEAIELAG